MNNEDVLIDKALDYASTKVSFKFTKNIMEKRNKLLASMPEESEKAVNEYGEAILEESRQFYEKAMHYLAGVRNLADSDILQELLAIAS